jgi:arylsulfatase A-like enzyme
MQRRVFGKWHLGNVEGRVPTDQGFDEWWGISESSDEASYTAHPLYPDDWPVPKIQESRRGETPRGVADFDLQTRPLMDERITERSVEFIKAKAASGQPFFRVCAVHESPPSDDSAP